MGICCMTQGTQSGGLEKPRGVGWGGRWEGEGTWVYLWLFCVVVWQKPTQYCNAVILQFFFFFQFKKI